MFDPRFNRRSAMQIAAASTAAAAMNQTPTFAQDDHQTYPTHQDTFGLLRQGKKIPVIFDTDIGGDIDDTWALLYLINCPELDVRLVATDAGLGPYRARLTAKYLTECGRDDIAIAVGDGRPEQVSHQQDWVGAYDLENYAGPVKQGAVDAIIQAVHASEDPVTMICIGAVPNIAAAIKKDPTICNNARFVGMHGAINVGYSMQPPAVPEANVRTNPPALRDVFAAPWQCSITPLDTCGDIVIDGPAYQAIYQSDARGVQPLIANYQAWLTRVPWLKVKPDPTKKSSVLFDLVAVYMAYSEDLLNMETLPIAIDDAGLTYVDDGAPKVRCAMSWKDRTAFEAMLVERLTKPT